MQDRFPLKNEGKIKQKEHNTKQRREAIKTRKNKKLMAESGIKESAIAAEVKRGTTARDAIHGIRSLKKIERKKAYAL